MSKPIKEMIQKVLAGKIDSVTSLAVVCLSGVDATSNNLLRGRLIKEDISLMVVKNSIARQAFKDAGISADFGKMLNGPCALAWGSDNIVTVVRELLAIKKELAPNMEVTAAMLDGDIFGEERITELSKFPTREEAIAKVIGCALSAGSNLLACIVAPGGAIASCLKKMAEDDDTQAA